MTEEETKEFIRQELKPLKDYLEFFNKTNFNFEKHITILNNKNIQVGKGVGTIIATEGGATGQKLGFWGTLPKVQPSAISDPTGGSTVDTEARAKIIAIRDALKSLGLIA